MAINFEQPDAPAYSQGALQAYLQAAEMNRRARLEGMRGGGGGGGGPGFGGWGVQGLGGGGGGHDGGGGGSQRDIVGEYAAMQGIDAQTRQDDMARRTQWLQQHSVEGQSPEDQQRMAQLQQRQQQSQYDPSEENWANNAENPNDPGHRAPVEFSTADKLELDKLNAGAAQVRQQLREGNIDRRTANDMMAQINTGLSPLRTQQQAATTQLQQQAAQQQMHQQARQMMIENMNGTERAQYAQQHTVDLGNGNFVYTGDPSGRPHFGKNDAAVQQQRQQQQQETQDTRQTEAAYRQARTAVEREATAYERSRATRPDAPAPGWYDGPTLQGAVEREIRRRAEAHLQNAQRQRGQTSRQQERLDSLGAVGTDGNLRTSEDGPEPQPIAPDANRESLPVPQQESLATFDDFSRRIARLESTGSGHIGQHRRDLNQAMLLYHQYGTTAAMPADIRRRVEHIVTQLNTLPAAPRRRPAPPAQQAPEQQLSIQPGLGGFGG